MPGIGANKQRTDATGTADEIISRHQPTGYRRRTAGLKFFAWKNQAIAF